MRRSVPVHPPDTARPARRVLLLQGPMGPFFRRFAAELKAHGHTVLKINFNGGDRFFFGGPSTLDFTGPSEDWPAFLTAVLADHGIERIYLFGDCRWPHRVARRIAAERGIELFVFEEGYLRPDYVTLEADGVNGYSSIPRDPARYVAETPRPSENRSCVGVGRWPAAWHAVLYSLASVRHSACFPHYRHHRSLDLAGEAGRWIVAGVRGLAHRFTERPLRKSLLGRDSPPYFLVPLQVHHDAQVVVHSPYDTVEDFIGDVLRSFAMHAPPSSTLVFKHHPLDHAYRDHAGCIRRLATTLRVIDRVGYLHTGNLPRLVHGCRGLITINSTVGLSALQAGRPVKVLGNAIYDFQGLTFQGNLDAFWRAPGTVDLDLLWRFRGWLLRNVQATGSFYHALSNNGSPTGMEWPPAISATHGLHGVDSRHLPPGRSAHSEDEALAREPAIPSGNAPTGPTSPSP